ncbi:MAG: sulfotransferase domain-containing protein [Verrucomicrobiales bacterium]
MSFSRPNFFVVGAPKCGTTALYHALLRHPEVFLPHSDEPGKYWISKEPHFFADDLGIEDWIRLTREEDYRALFSGAGDRPRVGEVSALYLFSSSAPRRILDYCGDSVRIIILLRPPVDWMRSWHHDCLRYAHEDIGDFRTALEAGPEREEGRELHHQCGFKGCLNYRKLARSHDFVERYFEVFGRERVKVHLLEDLTRDPVGVLREVATFLGISSEPLSSIERQNDSAVLSRTHLWEFRIRRALGNLPLGNQLFAAIPRGPLRLYRKAVARWLPPLSDKLIDPDLRSSLIEEFRPEVEKLGRLIGRDLSHWNE